MDIAGKTLSGEQVALFKRMSKLQQGVALGVLSGLSQREAYLQAGGKSTGATADVSANQCLKSLKARAFMDSFRAEETDRLAEVVMGRQEMAEMLTGVARDRTEGVQGRLGAAKQLSVLMGYDKPQVIDQRTTMRALDSFYADMTPEERAAERKAFADDFNAKY